MIPLHPSGRMLMTCYGLFDGSWNLLWYLVVSIFQFFVCFDKKKIPCCCFPASFLLINKLHIFINHQLPSVCQFYKLEKISGKRKGGLQLMLCAGPSGVREAAGGSCWAGSREGGQGTPHQGTSLLLPPELQLLPKPCVAQAWRNTQAPVLQLWGWLLETVLLLKDYIFCWAERYPGWAALFLSTTLRDCCGQSSCCIHSSLAQSYVIVFNCVSCSAFGTIDFPCHKHWN